MSNEDHEQSHNIDLHAMNVLLHARDDIDARQVAYDWGTMYWFGHRDLGNTTGLTMGRMVMKPRASNGAHHHPNCEEVLYLLKGRVEHRLGDAVIVQEVGDFVTVPPGVSHQSTNLTDDEADLIIAFSSAARAFVPE